MVGQELSCSTLSAGACEAAARAPSSRLLSEPPSSLTPEPEQEPAGVQTAPSRVEGGSGGRRGSVRRGSIESQMLSRFQPASEDKDKAFLERFQSKDKLGQGAFGVVLRARDTKMGRDVAIRARKS